MPLSFSFWGKVFHCFLSNLVLVFRYEGTHIVLGSDPEGCTELLLRNLAAACDF